MHYQGTGLDLGAFPVQAPATVFVLAIKQKTDGLGRRLTGDVVLPQRGESERRAKRIGLIAREGTEPGTLALAAQQSITKVAINTVDSEPHEQTPRQIFRAGVRFRGLQIGRKAID